ncbi:MAG: hypothetical protein ACYDCQ_18155 [Dehalococcoidia bacterium]
MTTESPAKPAYLGLLNALSVGEHNNGVYLQAWAEVAQDPALKQALALVAARETGHGEVFRQRIERLGFSLREREKDDADLAARVAFYGDAAISDAEKINRGRQTESAEKAEGARDVLADIEARITDDMDPLTRDTMRWYLAEERDSTVLLKEAYARVRGR